MINTFTKVTSMPGYHEHVISDPANIQSLSEKQNESRQCGFVHLKQVKRKLKVVAHRKRDIEPSRVSSRVL